MMIAYALPTQDCDTCENINHDHQDRHLVDLYNGELLFSRYICPRETCKGFQAVCKKEKQ